MIPAAHAAYLGAVKKGRFMLTFYPPDPAEGPESILGLPPDDWALEPKLNGIRVVWAEGRAWTRQGRPLTPAKGAARLAAALAGVDAVLDGEWLPAVGTYYAFDLPDALGDYDERTAELALLVNYFGRPGLKMIAPKRNRFPSAYADLRDLGMEGVVLKRRNSKYPKRSRPRKPTRDWLKRLFAWDNHNQRKAS